MTWLDMIAEDGMARLNTQNNKLASIQPGHIPPIFRFDSVAWSPTNLVTRVMFHFVFKKVAGWLK